MRSDKIRFSWLGKDYEVGMEAYYEGKNLLLPDGTVLQVGAWLESLPPQPHGMTIIPGPPIVGTTVMASEL